MATMSAREFNQDVSAAKREAKSGPLVITDRGSPAFVLLSIDDYRRLSGQGRGIDFVHRMSMEDSIHIEFSPVEVGLQVPDL